MAFTLEQLTQVPHVMGVVSEFNGVGSTVSRFYGLSMGNTPSQVIDGRTGVYDVFNPTRTMPVVRAPMSGPSKVARKPVGQKMVTVSRFYEALDIEYERIWRNRPLGGRYGTVDNMGMQYIARQYKHEITKFANAYEFMAINAMRGGWSLLPEGEDLHPVELGTDGSQYDVETLVPDEHKAQIPLGPGDANIISVSWDDPNADIVAQFFALDKVSAVRHGSKIKHIWGNSDTLAPLFNNIGLQRISGTAISIYDSMTGRAVDPEQKYPDTGVDIVFKALPGRIFHMYNQVYSPGLVSESYAAQTNPANLKFLIPDNEVIMTPEPGDWCELVAGSEPVQFNMREEVRRAYGFAVGRDFAIDPPRVELKFLTNIAPVLTQYNAVYNPTVVFEEET
jgi:hypothetical protein